MYENKAIFLRVMTLECCEKPVRGEKRGIKTNYYSVLFWNLVLFEIKLTCGDVLEGLIALCGLGVAAGGVILIPGGFCRLGLVLGLPDDPVAIGRLVGLGLSKERMVI